jgi:hypothetical protein
MTAAKRRTRTNQELTTYARSQKISAKNDDSETQNKNKSDENLCQKSNVKKQGWRKNAEQEQMRQQLFPVDQREKG